MNVDITPRTWYRLNYGAHGEPGARNRPPGRTHCPRNAATDHASGAGQPERTPDMDCKIEIGIMENIADELTITIPEATHGNELTRALAVASAMLESANEHLDKAL